MSNPDRAAQRLRVVRFLPNLVEGAFRAAVREAVFVRCGHETLGNLMRARARFHFDRALIGTSLGEAARERALSELLAAIERFEQSALCRRLSRVPVDRLYAISYNALDLLALSRDGKRFGLRFTGLEQHIDMLGSSLAIARSTADLDAILIYDIGAGRLRRSNFRRTRPVLSA